KRWYEGYQPARYYTIAWSTFLLGGVILALNKFNIIPRNLFTEHALQIGSAMEVMLLSFALADRLNTEKRDRFEAQQEALKLEKTASKAQKEALDQERNARIAQEKALEHERQAREAQARALEIQHRATETLEEKVRERTAELQVANARLEQMSSTDALTNVPNRRHFEEVLSHEFALAVHDQMPLGVMMIDIDFFKAVNDQFGHQTGDEILRCIAETINDQVSDHDLVARYGGEEFVVVAPLKEANKTLALAERIRKSIAEYDFSRIIDGLNMTVSIGVHAGIPKKTEHQDQWVAMADTALYNSKEQGRNKVTLANQVK
ncbi:MAG: diguanylate cyclase, partial [Oleibacter sp.]|nr:diguanylate cyclase [Thalassolituus sp.]